MKPKKTEWKLETAPSTNQVREFLTSKEVANWLGISLRTVVNLRRRRVLPYVKFGRVVRFQRDLVMIAIKAHTVEGKSICLGE